MEDFENGVTAGVADQMEENPTENAETTESNVETTETNAESGAETTVETQQEPDIPNEVWATSRKRSEKEYQQKLDRVQQGWDKEFAQRFAGYKNPETGAYIHSMQDYLDAYDAQCRLERKRAIEQVTANQNAEQRAALQRILENDPEKAQLKAEMEQLKAARVNDEAQKAFERDFAELQKLEPALKTQQDLAKLEGFDEIVALCQKGIDMVTAYKAVNYGKATRQSREAGQQAAINAAKGKTHLAAHGGESENSRMVPVPESTMRIMKEQFPGKSMNEITKLYNQTM